MCADFINTQWGDKSELVVGETERGAAEATQKVIHFVCIRYDVNNYTQSVKKVLV